MSDLANQKINFSFGSLLQVPGGLTSSLQTITDGNGVSGGLQISTTGVSGQIVSDTVDITGGTIDGTTIGSVNPYPATFSTLTVDSLTGLLKASAGLVTTATSGSDYAPATSGTSILKGNGSGGFSSAVANTDYQSVISATGLLKGAGSGSISGATAGVDYSAGTSALATGILKSTTSTGALSIAASGTDYAPATSGTSILSGNGVGGFANVTIGPGLTFVGSTISTITGLDNTKLLASNGLNGFSIVTVGSGLQYSGGVLSSTSGGGSVTTVSVVSANGFAGTVANASSTPAITLTTSITGLLKGNGTAISAATSGTDYAPATSGSSILKGNAAGGFSAAVAKTDYAPATSGTSILKGDGLGGFSNAASGTDYAPATSGTSLLKGDGAGGFSNAVAGTDYAGLASANTFTNNQVISVSSSSDALRITQTGAGNALVVEDSANPDSTPFVVNADGKTLIGQSVETPTYLGTSALLQINEGAGVAQSVNKFTNNANSANFVFAKGRGSSTVNTAVVSGDKLGQFFWVGADGTGYIPAASIYSEVDGTPGTNDMPGRLVFSTTADGASSPTERMRIDSAGAITIAGLTASSAVATDSNKKLVSVTNTGSGNNVLATSPTLTTATITGSRETKTAPSISAGTLTLDCSAGNVFAVSLNASITTLSFSNVPTTGTAYALTLSLTADGTARTVTWGAAVKWPSGTSPTLTSTNGKVDTFVLTTWDGGTTWYAFTAGQNA